MLTTPIVRCIKLQLGAEIDYLNGMKEGEMRTYHRSGKLSGIAYFKKDHHFDFSRAWFENGNIRAEAFFEDGLQEGIEIQYFKNGKKKGEAIFKKGLLDGLATQWYESGVKKSEIFFKQGKKTEKQKFWDKNGNLVGPDQIEKSEDNSLKFTH